MGKFLSIMQRQLDTLLLSRRRRWHYNSFTDRLHYERASKWATTRCLTPNTREERSHQQNRIIWGGGFYQLCNANSTPCCSLHDADVTTIPSRIDSTMKELQNEPPTVV